MTRFLYISLFFFVGKIALPQPAEKKLSPEEYIEQYKEAAITEMHESRIPASITLAQAMLESGNGNSPLAVYAKNHFGIKCHSAWKGSTFILDDDKKDECFRKYRKVNESYKDHSEFLVNRKWYASLFELRMNDYKGWAYGLKKAGYATNPKYAELLIDLIETHQLYKYDLFDKIPSKKLTVSRKKTEKLKNIERPVEVRNNIKYVIAAKNDTYIKLAADFNMHVELLYKYNDLTNSSKIKEGEIIYLQPKRRRSDAYYHILSESETLRDISQIHGVKLRLLCKYNNLTPDSALKKGIKIWLRRPGKKQE